MGTNKFVNMQKIVLALLVAAVSAKSVALPKIENVNQLLDMAKIATDCEGTGTATTDSGSGSAEACKALTADCIKIDGGAITFDCATSACKESATCMGKQMCKAAANTKDPAKCRKAIEGSFESNCGVKCDDPTVVIIIVVVVVVLLLGVGLFCYCRKRNAAKGAGN